MARAVKEYRADIGIALDGDADRLVICDERGQVVDGDQIMAIIADSWAKTDRLKGGGVVATIMSNLGLERFLRERGMDLIRTPVGDRAVMQKMREGGYNLGSTAASTEACLRVLLGEQPGCLPGARFPSPCGWKAIEEARRVQSQFWRSLQPPAPTRLHEPAALCVGSASWSDRGRATISAEAGPQRSDTPQHFSPQDERLGLGRSPGPTLAQRLLRPRGGQAGRSRTRILLTIHKRAMRAFWNRRRRSAAPSL